MANIIEADNPKVLNDLEYTLKQRRSHLDTMNERLIRYKEKNLLMLEKEKELDQLAQVKYEQEQRRKEDEIRLDKERQELYAELQRQQAAPQPRPSPSTTLSPLSSSQHQQPTSFPAHNDNFGKVSEQEAIAWLKQRW